MLLRTYIDDSADETHEKAVVAGAYVGFYHQWNMLTKQWKKRLKQDGIRFFHAADYYGLHGPFAVFADPIAYPRPKGRKAAKGLIDDLEEIVHEAQVMGVAVCVDMKAYRNIRETEPHADRIFSKDAFESALQALIGMCAEIVRDEWELVPRKIAFVCDESGSAPRISQIYTSYKRENPILAYFMGDLVHQDDKLVPALQSADMLAHLAKGRFIDWLGDPEKKVFTSNETLKQRLKTLSVHKIAVWDRRYMLDVLAHETKRRGLIAGI
jgi:hypothetical protein